MLVKIEIRWGETKDWDFWQITEYLCTTSLLWMDRLRGPIISSFFCGEHLEGLDQIAFDTVRDSFEFRGIEDEEEQFDMLGLEDKMPFLQMLQSVEPAQAFPLKEPNFQTLLRLQHLTMPLEGTTIIPQMEIHVQATELESCVTQDMLELQSPVKSESNDLEHQRSASCMDRMNSGTNQEQLISAQNCVRDVKAETATARANPPPWHKQTQSSKSHLVTRERRKRKRTRPTKNKEDIENQRMTHITVERNRRRQMNDHLSVLRSLMPTYYIQRGDQASIIGGAIDFVKELEQLLQSLEAQKRIRKGEDVESNDFLGSSTPDNGVGSCTEGDCAQGMRAEKKSEAAEIEVTVIHTHVNLKIQCLTKPGLLLKAIVALEDLRLTVLHLNITSSQDSALYSFNLKIEEDCKLGSANEIAEAVQHMFSFIHGVLT